jgi:hypothetical protein
MNRCVFTTVRDERMCGGTMQYRRMLAISARTLTLRFVSEVFLKVVVNHFHKLSSTALAAS